MPGFLLKLEQTKASRSRLPATSQRMPKRYMRASLTKLRSVPRCFKTDRDSLSPFKSSKSSGMSFHEGIQSLQLARASHSTEKHTRAKAVNKTSVFSQLVPFLDDDRLLRIGSRQRHADMSHAAKHPVILPRKGQVTNLIIAHCRQAVEHQGSGTRIIKWGRQDTGLLVVRPLYPIISENAYSVVSLEVQWKSKGRRAFPKSKSPLPHHSHIVQWIISVLGI